MMDTSQRVAVLTYNCSHRKTYDTLCLLRARGYDNIIVYAHSMMYRKRYQPLIEHRPQNIIEYPLPENICSNFGYTYAFVKDYDNIQEGKDTVFLLCGAGLIDDNFIKNHRIINSHPGYIPFARGLDAYKWEIYYNLPIGVTTHFLGKYIDAGEIIERREILVGQYDTFHSVAERVYQNEIDMLVGAIEKVNDPHEFMLPQKEFPVHRRMPHEKEKDLFNRFRNRKPFLIKC